MTKYKRLTKLELEKLCERKEDLYFDRKSPQIKPIDLQKTIIAFANTEGGEIIIGISDNGKCNGFEHMSKYDDIIHSGIFNIKPVISELEYFFLNHEKRFLILIRIPKSDRVHESSKSDIYIRVGASNKKLNQDEIQALRYKKGEIKFEEETKNIDLEAISKSTYIKQYLKRLKIKASPKDFLISNGFVFNKKPKVSSIICFHDKPQNILKCGIKINRYEMNKTARKYAYVRKRKESDKTIFGNLENLIKESLKTIFDILSNLNIQYPEEAIIEGFVNAVLHRDYSISEDVIVNIYDNKIEIISPGGLPGKIREEDLNNRKIIRYLRNPIINNFLFSVSGAEVDFNKRLNQDQGEGILTIFNSMKKAGLKEPEFKEIDNKVHLNLRHESAQSYESKILNFLENNDTIANKDARELLGEEDKEKVKNVFLKLEKTGKIVRIDYNVAKNKIRYKKTGRKIIESEKEELEQMNLFDESNK